LPILGGYFDLDKTEQELPLLEQRISRSDFWQEADLAKKVSQYYQNLKQEYLTWQKLKREVEDLEELTELFEKSGELSEHQKELEKKLKKVTATFEKLEFAVLFSGEYDGGEAVLSIHAGTGGVDAMDWASMLLRMYLRLCERHGFTVKIIDETAGAEAGIKSVTLEVSGRFAYGWLRSEGGVHRLVRISPFDAEKMRHTSFALVEVLPVLDEDPKLELKDEDFKIDFFRAGGHGGQSVNTTDSAVRITHLPSGLAVKCQNERSQLQNKNTAFKILKSRIFKLQQEQALDNLLKIKGDYRQAQWGNQARSYVLQPYKLVKDHRTELETTEVDRVLDGEIDDFVESYLRLQKE
jgi:peptide chain release factor 2